MVHLWDTANGNAEVPISITLDANNARLLKVTANSLLEENTRYRLYLRNTILDTDGDSQATNYDTYFTTGGAVEDDRQPIVLAMSPTEGSDNVGVNTAYAVRYDETMNPLVFDPDGNRYNVRYSESNQVVRYNRLGSLAPETTVTEVAPVLVDAANNPSTPSSVTFTSGTGPDFERASVIDTTVTNGQVVAINPVLEWRLNEPIDPVSITGSGVRLYDHADNVNVPVTLELSADGRNIKVVPQAALELGHRHTYYAYSLRDLSGNAANNTSRYFDSNLETDLAPPEVVNKTLNDGHVDVPTNVRLNVKYNEPLNAFELAGISLVDGGGIPVPINISLTNGRRTLLVVPKVVLAPSTSYVLTVDGIQDLSGNTPDTPLIMSFTTGQAVDLAGGGLSWRSIPYNSTAPTNAQLKVRVTERVDPTSVVAGSSLRIYDTTTGQNLAGSVDISEDGRTLSFLPSILLEVNRLYYWYIGYSPYFFDLAGNRVALNQFSIFRTGNDVDEDPPQVVEASIADGNTGMPVNGRIVVALNEPLSDQCDLATSAVLSTGGIEIDTSVSLSPNRLELLVSPVGRFSASTTYSLAVGGACDYAGNVMPDQSLLSFTTLASNLDDTLSPQLISISPAANATGVSVTTEIVMTFSEDVDARRMNLALMPGYIAGAPG